jgi:nucleotide-binding universal stress UspA family protein
MKILLAWDGSSSSDAVIREAAARPWPEKTEFLAVTALDPFFFTHAPLLLEEAKKSTCEALEEQAKQVEKAGWNTQTQVVLGNPRHGLPRVADEWCADLILIGSHGRGAIGRLLVGSTAQAVLRHAHCSVQIVRHSAKNKETGGTGGMQVLIPTDGSELAMRALQSVTEMPWPRGSEFKVLSSPEFPVLGGEYPYYAPEQVAQLSRAGEIHAKEAVAKGLELLTKAGLQAGVAVTEPKDTPAHAILSAAEEWQADLIVMGSHGRRGFDRIVLGSVSETVALHAKCSVELVRKLAK